MRAEAIEIAAGKPRIHTATQDTPEASGVRLLSPVEPTYGPQLNEILYQAGGMTKLIEEAQLSRTNKVTLTPEDLLDPNRLPDIHYPLRDILAKGKRIELASWGTVEVFRPKLEIVYEKER